MKRRYRIQNDTHFVEMPYSVEGKQFLEDLRKSRKEFKHRWITDAIQAYPSQIPEGVILGLDAKSLPGLPYGMR